MSGIKPLLVMLTVAAMLFGCSSTKHVPEGQMLLDNVHITVDSGNIDVTELHNFLRQQPNHKVLGFAKLQLATYSLSGRDSSKWYNRWLRSLGQPPVIYDEELTEKSRKQLQQALINRGYMDVKVEVDTVARHDKKRMDVSYNITTGRPHIIKHIGYNIPDTAIERIILSDTMLVDMGPGDLFDRNRLDQLRSRVATRLRDNGYYTFSKDNITFTADTVEGDKNISLTLNIRDTQATRGDHSAVADQLSSYDTYVVRNVYFVPQYNPQADDGSLNFSHCDTVSYKGIKVLYGDDRYLKPQILDEKCYIVPGHPYSAAAVENTYAALGQLDILKFVNIVMQPAGSHDGVRYLDAYVLMSRNKKQGVILELEGTNSEGDLGFGVGATYQNRNLARGSELLTAKLRTSYESLSGNFEGLVNNRYTEYAGEVGITFPKFEFPFLSGRVKKKLRASTEFALSMNYQERPEYTRVIAGAAWKYKWTRRRRAFTARSTFDLIDINYVKLPRSTINFLDSIAPTNPLLRYSYEDHFIMRLGYTLYRTNKRMPNATTSAIVLQPHINTCRFSVEMAGNLLYGISHLIGQNRRDGVYNIFGIQYSQYVKGEADYTYTRNINFRSSVAFHIGGGIAYPYGNSRMVPFEKRFYAGGANSVRGWSARTLGPGSYETHNSVTNFINQCGDILLNMSIEYRAKIFWVIEGAAFVDAGNIWTIRSYENQRGGVFRFSEFYKQIAGAYGVGLRLDFTYFLLRFDLGIKAHNPAANQEHWPLFHPRLSRDANFHFAVGYPF